MVLVLAGWFGRYHMQTWSDSPTVNPGAALDEQGQEGVRSRNVQISCIYDVEHENPLMLLARIQLEPSIWRIVLFQSLLPLLFINARWKMFFFSFFGCSWDPYMSQNCPLLVWLSSQMKLHSKCLIHYFSAFFWCLVQCHFQTFLSIISNQKP